MNRSPKSFRRWLAPLAPLALLLGVAGVHGATPDEGMWPLNTPPVRMMQREYGFAPSPEWLEHLQKSAVKFGASASFVSPDGLVLTNHHVARSQLAKLSTPERDLLTTGHLATSRADELKCPDATILCLQEIVDVTDRVKLAAAGSRTLAEAEAKRKAAIAAIEIESKNETGLHSDVVTLYEGGLYHLYRYKRFTDVRIVFAPEGDIAHFGGDVDNFEFPRYCLDMTLVRVYDDDGEPYRPEHYLRFTTEGVEPGEPVFVVGHPGSTQRQFTTEHLRFLRDVSYPRRLHQVRTREVELRVLSSQGAREESIATRDLMGYQNARKGLGGKLRALQDPRIFQLKVEDENDFRRRIAQRADLQRLVGSAWDDIARAQEAHAAILSEYAAVEGGYRAMGGSDLFAQARTIVRLVEERDKPDADRLSGYHESNMPSIERRLQSPAPIHDFMEVSRIESHIAFAAEVLGGEHPLVVKLLGGKSPRDRALELVEGSNLADPAYRRQLVDSGKEAVLSSDDSMIRFALEIDPIARQYRQRMEDEVDAVERDAYARLAAARFSIYGQDVYPDATGTLRLSTGRVAGFVQESEDVGPFTTIGGTYDRLAKFEGHEQFDLPESWIEAKDDLDLSTPFNLVSTNDIIGGNSGSPLVNREGELVGLIFDGNRYSFVWDAIYEGQRGRAVSVDARAIIETLDKVYDADALVKELMGESQSD